MGGRLAPAAAIQRSAMAECQGGGLSQEAPPSEAQPLRGEFSSTEKRSGRRLRQEADIRSAINWRLRGVPTGDMEVLAEALRPLAEDFREDRAELEAIIGDLRYPGDRRAGWSLACAILAYDADRRGDMLLFFKAGFEVAKAMDQSRRGHHHNRQRISPPDALDALIAEHLKNHPSISVGALFKHFSEMAGSVHEVLADFDPEAHELVCQLDLDDERLTNVGDAEFTRRVRRAIQQV